MFWNDYELRRLEALAQRSDQERVRLVSDLKRTLPFIQKATKIGIYAMAAKNFAPAVRPIVFGLIQRVFARRGRSGLFKLAGLVSTAIGISRAFSSKERRAESAALN